MNVHHKAPLSEQEQMMLDAAIAYIEQGLNVVPVEPGKKHPCIPWRHFQHKQVTEDQARHWWGEIYKGYGIALICGQVSKRVFVVDVDEGQGKIGGDTLDDLCMANDDLPETWTARTGGGGRHLFFRAPEGFRVKTATDTLGKNLDTRGDGGLVVLPPSKHASGRRYEWKPGYGPDKMACADAPEWLIDLLRSDRCKADFKTEHTGNGTTTDDGVTRNWCGHVVDGRDRYMANILWAYTCNFLKRHGRSPNPQEMFNDCWNIFETTTVPRGAETLEEEGKHTQEKMRAKIRSTLKPEKIAETKKANEHTKQKTEGKSQTQSDPGVDPRKLNPVTQVGMAEAVASDLDGFYLFDKTRGVFRGWDGERWSTDKGDEVKFAVIEQLKTMVEVSNKQVLKNSYVKDIVDLLRSNPTMVRKSEDFDRAANLLTTPAGTCDLRTGSITPNAPGNMITRSTGIAPSRIPTPRWDDVLTFISGGDQDFKEFLQVMAGYCLTGETKEQIVLIIYGDGQNAKSLFANTIKKASGEFAISVDATTFLTSGANNHPEQFVRLDGPRSAFISEVPPRAKFNEKAIKEYSGGDDVTARDMGKSSRDFKPIVKLLFLCNDRPDVSGSTVALSRRMRFIPFEKKVPDDQVDRNLEEKLQPELPGILQWMIDGAKKYYTDGLPHPTFVADAGSAFFDDQDITQQWLDECCEVDDGLKDTARSLFHSWKEWTDARGYPAGNASTFGRVLTRKGFEATSSNGVRGRKGLRATNSIGGQ